MWTIRTKIGWSLLMLGALLMAFVASRYFTLDPQVYFPRQRAVYEEQTLGLMAHIGGMTVAVLSGPLQFLRPLRERRAGLHRLLGRFYLVGALVGGLGGLYMAPLSASGAVSDVGFALLAVSVLLTTAVAYLRIRAGLVQSHREWMTRSYALIFAAVTLRIYLPFLEAAFGEYNGYAAVAWACWVPNLLFAEWLIRSALRRRPETSRTVRAAGLTPG